MECHTLDTSDTFTNGVVPDDENRYGCEICGADRAWQLERCETCPRNRFVKIRMNSELWPLLERAIDLEKHTNTFSVDWGDVDALEAEALDILKHERARLQSEQFKKDQERMERNRNGE
jgi:hypothetical protein